MPEKEATGKTPNNLQNVEPKETPEVKLGDYTGNKAGDVVLTQDQMLGIGGGVEFFEILDADGNAIKHVAMPVLLRDRSRVKDMLKRYARNMMSVNDLITNKDGKESEEIIDELDKMEEMEFEILLRIAYYCFSRTDRTLKGKAEDEGIVEIAKWIDINQLRDVHQVAMGLNKLSPLRMGAAALRTLPQ